MPVAKGCPFQVSLAFLLLLSPVRLLTALLEPRFEVTATGMAMSKGYEIQCGVVVRLLGCLGDLIAIPALVQESAR